MSWVAPREQGELDAALGRARARRHALRVAAVRLQMDEARWTAVERRDMARATVEETRSIQALLRGEAAGVLQQRRRDQQKGGSQ